MKNSKSWIYDSHQVAHSQHVIKLVRRRVMLHGHEQSVENDAYGDSQVYKGVHHDQVNNLLDLQPYGAAFPDKVSVGKLVPAWWTVSLRFLQFFKPKRWDIKIRFFIILWFLFFMYYFFKVTLHFIKLISSDYIR